MWAIYHVPCGDCSILATTKSLCAETQVVAALPFGYDFDKYTTGLTSPIDLTSDVAVVIVVGLTFAGWDRFLT